MRIPDIELLWWAGCPSTDRSLSELRAVLRDLGLASAQIRTREIGSEENARSAGFVGSPTILIDGVDAVPATDAPVALSCRVYRRRDGTISPTPDPDELREALRRAATREEVKR
jgi:hypothetical protein